MAAAIQFDGLPQVRSSNVSDNCIGIFQQLSTSWPSTLEYCAGSALETAKYQIILGQVLQAL